jgi:hypothetical protein
MEMKFPCLTEDEFVHASQVWEGVPKEGVTSEELGNLLKRSVGDVLYLLERKKILRRLRVESREVGIRYRYYRQTNMVYVGFRRFGKGSPNNMRLKDLNSPIATGVPDSKE